MKIKVGDQWFECQPDQPIMVVLEEGDKRNIAAMDPDCSKYALFDDADGLSRDEQFAWMNDERHTLPPKTSRT